MMPSAKVLVPISIAAVIAVVVAGLWISGSPATQRSLRFDERRVGHLQRLVGTLEYAWTNGGAIPATLSPLVDGRRLSELPVDPVSGAAYEYEKTGEARFELCASFELPSSPTEAGNFWAHDAGRVCYSFDLTSSENGRR